MSFVKRYSLAVFCAIIALLGAVVGVLGLTVLAPAQQVQASIETDDPYVMTRQGVLGLYSDSVTVTAEADSGQTAWIAMGAPTDVQSWLEGRDYTEIIGVKNTLTDLEVEESAQSGGSTSTTDEQSPSSDEGTDTQDEQNSEEAEASTDVAEQPTNPIVSDMWTLIKFGTSTASVNLDNDDLELALIFATDGESPAPKITLTWETPTPYYMALSGFLVAIAFAFSAFASFVTVMSIRRRRAESAKKLEILDRAVSTDTTVIPVLDTDGPKLLEAPRAKKAAESESRGEEPKTLPDPPVFDDIPENVQKSARDFVSRFFAAEDEAGMGTEAPAGSGVGGRFAAGSAESGPTTETFESVGYSANQRNTGNRPDEYDEHVERGSEYGSEHEYNSESGRAGEAYDYRAGYGESDEYAGHGDYSELAREQHAYVNDQHRNYVNDPSDTAYLDGSGSQSPYPATAGDSYSEAYSDSYPATPNGFVAPDMETPVEHGQGIAQTAEVDDSDSTVETLPTDSAMLNMMALQSGMQIPSRRAMREAEKRGVSALMVGGRKFSMSRKEKNQGEDAQDENED